MVLHQQPSRPLHSKSEPQSLQSFVFDNGHSHYSRLIHKKATRRIAVRQGLPLHYFRGTLTVPRRSRLEFENEAGTELFPFGRRTKHQRSLTNSTFWVLLTLRLMS